VGRARGACPPGSNMQWGVCDPGELLAWQGRDGGWGHHRGGSWTEPTSCALLALAAGGYAGAETRRGVDWLGRAQRPDGGWPPCPGVEESTWVTALPVLVMAERPEWGDPARAVKWLLGQSGRESAWLHRLRQRLLGVPSEQVVSHAGWPFYPGTAAWVTPTAVTILALERIQRRYGGEAVRERIAAGREFLLARRCQDGGWNHGSSRALGYEAGSYAETTGLALLALKGVAGSRLAQSLGAAEDHYRRCRSAEGLAWLRLALTAHGRAPGPFPSAMRCRGVVARALCALAEAAAGGRNVFLS